MCESALEWYFDNFIANDSSKVEKKELSEELGDELFLSLLPDELQTLPESSQDETGSNISLDYSSQNPTAVAEVPAGSSLPEPGASPVHPQKPENIPQIQNIISTVKLGCCLDLGFIARKGRNVEYKPKIFKVLTMRLREPRTTAMIYESGSIVCVGARSVEQSRLAARKYARIVQKLGFPTSFLNFKIHNMVASCNTFPLSLEKLACHQPSSYEPELFPGLHYSVMPGITAAVFSSGKICLTGAKKEADIYKAFDIIYPILSGCRR